LEVLWDSEAGIATLSKSLILGLSYPYDWCFVPSTKGEDGDPIDVLVLHDAATSPGLVLKCKDHWRSGGDPKERQAKDSQ
jgi:inorganic pyrophosphatase